MGEGSQGHRSSLMTALGFERGVHGETTGDIDCCLIEFGSQLRRHRETVTEDAVVTRERNSSWW